MEGEEPDANPAPVTPMRRQKRSNSQSSGNSRRSSRSRGTSGGSNRSRGSGRGPSRSPGQAAGNSGTAAGDDTRVSIQEAPAVIEFHPAEAVHAVRDARRQLTAALRQRGGSQAAEPGRPNQQRPGQRQRRAALRRQQAAGREATPAGAAEAPPEGQGHSWGAAPPWVQPGRKGSRKGKGKSKKGRKGKNPGQAAAGRGRGNHPTRRVQAA